MKRLQYILSLILCLSFVSCSDDNENVEPELIVSTESVTLGNSSQTKSIHVKSNAAWTITCSESWCTVNPAVVNESGTHEVVVSVTENPDTEKRTATLTVTSGNLSKQVAVTQLKTDLLILTQNEYNVDAEGGEIVVELEITDEYEITIQNDWITHIETKAVSTDKLTFSVEANNSFLERTGTILFTLGELSETITIQQAVLNLSIEPDMTGMTHTAAELAQLMGIGWNLGNSLEVPSNETGWGNAKTTQGLISAVKAAGFNTIRIPCAWDSYIEDANTHKIKESWLARVKEVVDYCYQEDMYVMLNIHWDGGWLEENPTYDKQEAVNEKQKALWEQIAVYFRDYDEHLVFAGTNEVGHSGGPTIETVEVQLSYNQTFVDAVRSTGGRNSYRTLIVQAFSTNIEYAVRYLTVAKDIVEDRMMVEVHYYAPWDFCGLEADASWANVKYLWGKEAGYDAYGEISDWGQEDWLREQFDSMKTNFGDKGYPVVLGEYGALLRTQGNVPAQHVESRNYYLNYVTKQALSYGLIPVYWDNGATGHNGFGLFDRSSHAQAHPDAINAIIRAKD